MFGKTQIATLFALAFATALPLAADEVLNANPTMELGRPGDGAPGFRLFMLYVAKGPALAEPDRLYIPKTCEGGNPGLCLQVPGFRGAYEYMLQVEDFRIDEDCELEISFDAKAGPNEDGRFMFNPSLSLSVDASASVKHEIGGEKPKDFAARIPFRLSSEWKSFSTRLKVPKMERKYRVALYFGRDASDWVDSLCIDNFFIRKISETSGKPQAPQQAAVLPDRLDPVYFEGEKVPLLVKAFLKSSAPVETLKLSLLDGVAGAPFKTVEIEARKKPCAAGGELSLYEATTTLEPGRFGAFTTACEWNGENVPVVGGDVSVVHPPVDHPRLSPGWRLGCNSCDILPFGDKAGAKGAVVDRTDMLMFREFGSFERKFRIERLAGARNARFWGNWRMVEPREGEWTKSVVQPAMDMYKKYGIEPFWCLGTDMILWARDEKDFKDRLSWGYGIYPACIYAKATRKGGAGALYGYLDIPEEDLARYVGFAVESFGSQVKVWEVFNEPLFSRQPGLYAKYMKTACKAVKAKRPDATVLGICTTGDFNANAVKWVDDIAAADPDFESSFDGVSFHPYGNELDCGMGRYFRYDELTAALRSRLTKSKPLWNTEAFFLMDARNPIDSNYGDPVELSHFGAGEVQRHYLEGELNGVMASSSLTETSFYKTKAPAGLVAPSVELSGLNALSWLLKDMASFEELRFNKYIKTGVFKSADGSKALAFAYDLRPGGSVWRLPGDLDGVEVLDLFGNPVDFSASRGFLARLNPFSTPEKALALSYEPYYLRGEKEKVLAALRGSSFDSVKADRFSLGVLPAGEVLLFRAESLCGEDGVLEANVDACDPATRQRYLLPMDFAFERGATSAFVKIDTKALAELAIAPEARLSWRGVFKERSVEGASIKPAPRAPLFKIPCSGSLNDGSTFDVRVENGALKFVFDVVDPSPVQAKDSNLWNGSAVELFIDSDPISRVDAVQATSMRSVKQFAFAAQASETGAQALCVNGKTAASCESEKTGRGYRLRVAIPLSEIESSSGFLGIEIELDKRTAKGSVKSSLQSKPGSSFKSRCAYPLWELPSKSGATDKPARKD